MSISYTCTCKRTACFSVESWFGYNQSMSAMCIQSSMDRRASNTNTPAAVVQNIIIISCSSRCRPLFTASIPTRVSSHGPTHSPCSVLAPFLLQGCRDGQTRVQLLAIDHVGSRVQQSDAALSIMQLIHSSNAPPVCQSSAQCSLCSIVLVRENDPQ